MSKSIRFFLLFTLTLSAFSYAGQGGVIGESRLWRSNDENGGAGLPGKNGQPGMNGCPGGTRSSQDGKYYLPGTKEECNPAHKKRHYKNRNLSFRQSMVEYSQHHYSRQDLARREALSSNCITRLRDTGNIVNVTRVAASSPPIMTNAIGAQNA